jgi:hypothetical protein
MLMHIAYAQGLNARDIYFHFGDYKHTHLLFVVYIFVIFYLDLLPECLLC